MSNDNILIIDNTKTTRYEWADCILPNRVTQCFIIHRIPFGDFINHIGSLSCPCLSGSKPKDKIEKDKEGYQIIKHRSFDGREYFESSGKHV